MISMVLCRQMRIIEKPLALAWSTFYAFRMFFPSKNEMWTIVKIDVLSSFLRISIGERQISYDDEVASIKALMIFETYIEAPF